MDTNNQTTQNETIQEVVGIFDDSSKLQAAIDELSISGFDRHEISVIGDEKAMREKFNVSVKDPIDLVDNPQAPRGVNVATEEIGVAEGAVIGGGILMGVIAALVAAGGVTLPTTTPAAIIGGASGAAIGGVIAQLIGSSHAEKIQKQIAEGGLVLWVRVENQEKDKAATDILKKHEATYVHTHTISRANLELTAEA